MSYNKLNFGQYYIDTSDDWRKTGKARFNIEYNHVEYVRKILGLFPLKCSAEWECHYEEDRNVIQINFEQTNGWFDWIINLLFSAKAYDEFIWTKDDGSKEQIQLKACKGWMQMYRMMKHGIKESVRKLLEEHKEAEVEVIGWSLGSSQAQYCAQDLNFNLGIKSYLYTYGSVKPWKGKKNKEYLKSCCKEVYNFMHKRDIVTYMPPFVGYFAISPVKLGKFNFFSLFNPNRWHTEYGEDYLYEDVK